MEDYGLLGRASSLSTAGPITFQMTMVIICTTFLTLTEICTWHKPPISVSRDSHIKSNSFSTREETFCIYSLFKSKCILCDIQLISRPF